MDIIREPQRPRDGKKKFGRLAALADQINNWEDDLTHHGQVSVTHTIEKEQSYILLFHIWYVCI